MPSNLKYTILAYFSLIIVTFLGVAGCASMQRPGGGPRDLTPPKLISAIPANMTRNFKANTVELEFDEFFKLTNQYQEISISPAQEKLPEYKIRQKKLVIEFKDSLEKNTTYVINFGKSIADVNESNQLKNFTYVFSTGPHIDSLSISGTVTNSETQKPEKDATVLLFPLNKDTLFYNKKRPSIFAITDSAGNFSLNNLREDSYRIYALKEATANKIYDNENELVAFIKDTIRLSKDTGNIKLNLFQQEPQNFRFKDRRFDPDGKIFLSFNKQLTSPSIKIITPPNLNDQKLTEFTSHKDTAYVFMRTMDFDSVAIAVSDKGVPLDTVTLRKSRTENFKKDVIFGFNISADNKLKPGSDLVINTNLPIANINNSLIQLKEDSAIVAGFTTTKDSSGTHISLKHRWRQNVIYQITVDNDALTNIYGENNKKGAKKFTIDKTENYSILTLKVTAPDPDKQYIVQLLRNEKEVLRSDIITKNSSLVYNNILASKYRVKVIYDRNKNGKWDSGNIKQGQQPENIWVYEKEISLRPNWDAEENVAIPKERTTP